MRNLAASRFDTGMKDNNTVAAERTNSDIDRDKRHPSVAACWTVVGQPSFDYKARKLTFAR